jgi:hypothetical protein
MLPEISYKRYYQQRRQDSSTNNVTVKEDDFLELTKSQNLVYIKCVSVARYDWKYLIVERNCKLAVSFGISFYIDFFYLFLFSFIFSFFISFFFTG